MQNLDGKICAQYFKEKLSEKIKSIIAAGYKPPKLTVFLVGDNPASALYVKMKEKACHEIGIESATHIFDSSITEDNLIELIKKENNEPQTAGILVQLPLPKNFNEKRVLEAIDPAKDADCYLAENIGQMFLGNNITVLPCTPLGVMKLLNYYKIPVAGKEVCILGRSNVVGKPLALLMLQENATVTICHSKTHNIKEVTKRADILAVAIGRAKMVDSSYIKPGAVVIDVGINKIEEADGKVRTCGDCDYESVSKVASYVTPVPGGVGPMTIAMLLYNTVYNYTLIKNIKINMEL
ncbi:MAG: bifunctional methylenetetrahydrofolate dehydrogenase/methenyltetrahydrofolate cyclohydrolase FolD [Candidatus Wallbacteria bacterium]